MPFQQIFKSVFSWLWNHVVTKSRLSTKFTLVILYYLKQVLSKRITTWSLIPHAVLKCLETKMVIWKVRNTSGIGSSALTLDYVFWCWESWGELQCLMGLCLMWWMWGKHLLSLLTSSSWLSDRALHSLKQQYGILYISRYTWQSIKQLCLNFKKADMEYTDT